MKPTIMFTLSFLFIFASIPLVFSKEPVMDTDGNPLIGLGAGYYILPTGPFGGGVKPGVTGNQTFPVTVLQNYLEFVNGEPVKFNTGFRPGLVFTGEPLKEIAFANDTHNGASSSKWVVVSGDDFPKPWVGIGGAEDYPGKEILSGEFSIQKTNNGYKLVFSPPSPSLSFEIGIYNDDSGRRLALNGEGDAAFQLVFVDATSTS